MSRVVPRPVIEDIRARCDIEDVVGSYIPLKRAGTTLKALCPFHQEKTPSFTVNRQRQIFHCFGCGAGGDVIKFVMLRENVDFMTALRILAKRAGVELRMDADDGDGVAKDRLFQALEQAALFFRSMLAEDESAAEARAYLKSRVLDGEAAETYGIGFAPPGWNHMEALGRSKGWGLDLLEAAGLVKPSEKPGRSTHYDRFRNRLMFPIRDEIGRVVGFSGRRMGGEEEGAKYVNSPASAVFNKSRILYGLDRARQAMASDRTAILCEGQVDCIRCQINGFGQTVATQGTALSEDHARMLRRYADTVVLLLDADTAGQKAAVRGAHVLLAAGLNVSVAVLPAGEDPDSLLCKQGPEALASVLKEARSVVRFHVRRLRTEEPGEGQAALLRVARGVMETVRQAGGALQRDHMIREAAQELNLSEAAFRRDLERSDRPVYREEPSDDEGEPVSAPPPEAWGALELLIAHPDTVEVFRRYAPPACWTDARCRRLYRALLDDPLHFGADGVERLEDEETKALATRLLTEPRSIEDDDVRPEHAARDLVMALWRGVLEQRRADARARASASPDDEARLLSLQLSQDLAVLRQGWTRAEPILACLADEAH